METGQGAPIPWISLFWVMPNALDVWCIVDVARPFDEVADVGGFRTLDEGHVDVWPNLRLRLCADYGTYPRGRVNWRAEDDRFLLILDPILRERGWSKHLAVRYALPADITLIMGDSHYRSRIHPPPLQPATSKNR